MAGSGSHAYPVNDLVGECPAIRTLRAQICHLAAFDQPGNPAAPTVLLQGETGTGKGLVARIIHNSGPRAHGPFVQINCSALPEPLLEAELFGFVAGAFTDAKRPKPGLFEVAAGGTLFLDEIDALPLPLQSKLLNAIETKQVRRLGAVTEQPVDVKCLAAAQGALSRLVAEGRFRSDLYYRLAVVVLDLPPMRNRGQDVLALAQHFLRRYAAVHGLPTKHLTSAAAVWLQEYDWPGNVRELSHLLERVMLFHRGASLGPQTLQRLCLPRPLLAVQAAPEMASFSGTEIDELAQIRQALTQTGGNVVRAARLLGLSRKAVRYRMRRDKIERPGLERARTPEAKAHGTITKRPVEQALAPAGDTGTPVPAWEEQSVVVLIIEMTWPASMYDVPGAAPWTVAGQWEHAISEQIQECGGVSLPGTPSLLPTAFGILQPLEPLPQRAVQAALAVRQLVVDARAHKGETTPPTVRLALHYGALLVEGDCSTSPVRVLAVGETLALPVRLLGYATPGNIVVSPQMAPLVQGWCVLQACPGPVGTALSDQRGVYWVVEEAPS